MQIQNIEKYRNEIFSSTKLQLKGVIRYNPKREGLKSNQSCCIIELDSGIADYYRCMVNKHYGLELIKPPWGAHISIIQGQEALEAEKNLNWGLYEGKEIEITYFPYPRYSGDTDNKYGSDGGWFWFLTVESEIFNTLRKELNLPEIRSPHLTIGRKKVS